MRIFLLNTTAAVFFWLMPNQIFCQLAPDLGVASSFALFTAIGAFNGDAGTTVTGDVGTNSGALSIPPGMTVNGQIVGPNDDPLSNQAAQAVIDAYADLALNSPFCMNLVTLNNLILTPGVYCVGSATTISGFLTLDAQNDPNALFIFLIDGALTTTAGSSINLINGANPCNTYWRVNGQVDIGGTFQGTIVAGGAINLLTGATLLGRGLSTAGAISTSANVVQVPPSCNCTLTITCPPGDGGVFDCMEDIPVPNEDLIAILDSCGVVTISFDDDTTGTGCGTDTMFVTRDYFIADGVSLDTCTQVFKAVDDTPPLFTFVPASITIQCTGTPGFGTATATDNCDGSVLISSTTSSETTSNCAGGSTTRVFTATDICGNTSSASQTLTYVDNQAPGILCPANVTVQCASQVSIPNPNAVLSSDNCGGVPMVAFVSDATINQTCINRFTIIRTFRATDACGNSSTCSQMITVFDNVAPTFTCPANVTVQCANLVPAPTMSLVAMDNCTGPAPTVNWVSDVTTNQTCINRFTITRTYRATDACGNSATCAQLITVFDNTIPTLSCPANVTVQCASQVPAPSMSLVAMDNCTGPAPTVNWVSDVTTNQTCINRFTITRTYRATDACGNSATCAQLITVFDNTIPTLSCPANVTVQCASQVPAVNTASVITADNCGTATVTHVSDIISNQTCVNRFILTRTYRATDACGNSATCTQAITVFDNTLPTIDLTGLGVPNGDTIEIQCFGQDPEWDIPLFDEGSVNATDNCGGNVTITFNQILQDEGNCSVDGYINLYRLTWTATDVCGNSTTAFVFLALIDTIAPIIIGVPDDITVDCDAVPGPPTLIYATDECLCACVVLFEEIVPAPGLCQDGLVIVRSWTALDACGNETIETQYITLLDDQGPELQMVQAELAGITDGTILEYTCNEGGIPEFFNLLNAGSVFSPVSCGGAAIISFDREITTTTNCETFGFLEQQTFTWEGVDPCGNLSTMTIFARLTDDEAPVLTGVPDTACIGDPSLMNVEATDNCEPPTLLFSDFNIPNPCGSGMAIRRTYEAFDACGNISVATAIIIPDDQGQPVISFLNPALIGLTTGMSITVNCSVHQQNYTSFGISDIQVEDACSLGVTVDFTERLITTGDCMTDGFVAILELIWTATDLCGNQSVFILNANVVDESGPVFVNFVPEITIGCNDALPLVNSSDNCGEVSVATNDSIVAGDCEFVYDIHRSITLTDACGNTTTRDQIIHVGNGSGPRIDGVEEVICDDLTIPTVTAYDVCAEQFVAVTMQQDTLEAPCPEGLVIRRTWTAVGICGSETVIHQTIIINDLTPPEILITSYSVVRIFTDNELNQILMSEADLMNRLNALDENSVFFVDECDLEIIPVFTVDTTHSANCNEDGYFERRVYTWTAIDVCGNASTLTFSVDILDDLPPVFTDTPVDMTIVCEPLPPAQGVLVQDPAQPVTIVYSESMLPGEEPGVFIVTRTWTATDACGNTAVHVQVITWIPDTFLECVITLPAMVECNSHGVVIGSILTGGLGVVTYNWEIVGEKCFIQGGQGTPGILIYVGWSDVKIILTVTDEFGCVSMCMITLSCVESANLSLAFLPSFINPETIANHIVPTTAVNLSNDPSAYLKHIHLWPNPTNESINLSFESAIEQQIQYQLINLLGQVALSSQVNSPKGFIQEKIDVSCLPEGSYLLQVKTGNAIHSRSISIIR